jgi:drug/metabolite transporter (DMT)-like permease
MGSISWVSGQSPNNMSYYALGLLLAAFSAFGAASSHSFLKSGDDKLAIRCWTSIVCAAIALPVAIWTGPLPLQFWVLMAGFVVLSIMNQMALVKSYEVSDFSHAYPVARGVVPLAMALLGIVVLGDEVSAPAFAGIFLITLGILSLAFGRSMSRHGWGLALFTGVTTVGYNIILAHGIRQASDAANFLAWLFVIDGVFSPLYMYYRSRSDMAIRLKTSWAVGWKSGVLSLLSFTAMTYAMRFAPVGIVSAIRESSVLIALVLAAMMLNERLDRWRIIAGLLIVMGAVAIIFG